MSTSLSNSLLTNPLLTQTLVCTYYVLGSPRKHSSTYSKSVMRAKYREQTALKKKDFYRKGGIWNGSWKMPRISGGVMTQDWWTVGSPLPEVWSTGFKRQKGEVRWNHILWTNTDHTPRTKHRTLSSDQNILRLLLSWSLPSSRKICTYIQKHLNLGTGKCKEKNKAR